MVFQKKIFVCLSYVTEVIKRKFKKNVNTVFACKPMSQLAPSETSICICQIFGVLKHVRLQFKYMDIASCSLYIMFLYEL